MVCHSAKVSFAGKLVPVWLAAFVFVSIISIIGIAHTAGMQLNDEGGMSGCLFTGKGMICKMNAVQHLSLWQSTFVAVPQKISGFALLVALAALVIAVRLFKKQRFNFPEREPLFLKLHRSQQPNNIFFNPLHYAFSQGILHPKIY